MIIVLMVALIASPIVGVVIAARIYGRAVEYAKENGNRGAAAISAALASLGGGPIRKGRCGMAGGVIVLAATAAMPTAIIGIACFSLR